MKALSVLELAALYGMNRQSIYKRINKGDLSKNRDGKIDLSEAIRVFGEPAQKKQDVATLQSTGLQKETEVDILKQQIDFLKQQLNLAHEREIFQRQQLEAKDHQIESMQLLLNAPKQDMTAFTDQDPVPPTNLQPEPVAEIATPEEPKRYPIPEQVEAEPEQRGFWSRFFKLG
ncbi:plasmid replication DNA-binding protein [Acinetobacter sp. ANC 4193]